MYDLGMFKVEKLYFFTCMLKVLLMAFVTVIWKRMFLDALPRLVRLVFSKQKQYYTYLCNIVILQTIRTIDSVVVNLMCIIILTYNRGRKCWSSKIIRFYPWKTFACRSIDTKPELLTPIYCTEYSWVYDDTISR